MATATWNETVLAESDDIVIVEGNAYFPADSLRREFFRPIAKTSACPWKGTAHYYDIEVSGAVNPGAAWYYPNPSPKAENITGRVAFWNGVVVTGAS